MSISMLLTWSRMFWKYQESCILTQYSAKIVIRYHLDQGMFHHQQCERLGLNNPWETIKDHNRMVFWWEKVGVSLSPAYRDQVTESTWGAGQPWCQEPSQVSTTSNVLSNTLVVILTHLGIGPLKWINHCYVQGCVFALWPVRQV